MRISAPRARARGLQFGGERIKRRILGDVPGVARRQYFPSPSDEYLSAGSAAGARRSAGPARSASLAVQSLLPSGTHVPRPDRTRLCRARETILSLPFALVLPATAASRSVSPRINRGDSPRAESPERYFAENRRDFER